MGQWLRECFKTKCWGNAKDTELQQNAHRAESWIEVVWAELWKVKTPLFLLHLSKNYFYKDFLEEM